MPLSRRYHPEHPPGEKCTFGFDFSPIIPVGVGIASATLTISRNSPPGAITDGEWTIGPVTWLDRTVYATLTGGMTGIDYLLRWAATDTDGNIWPRFCLVLCAATS
jgi:hypothetical protein